MTWWDNWGGWVIIGLYVLMITWVAHTHPC